MALDEAQGINIILSCSDAPMDIHLTLYVSITDKSLMDYYTNREQERKKRDPVKSQYDTVNKLEADISTIVRIDHLTR